MRIRHDPVFVSSLLFTIALSFRVPAFVSDAAYRDALWQAVGFSSLANIFVGLVVVWTGFIRRYRWAWLVMFLIVWIWAFPVLVLPIFHGKVVVTFTEWFAEAWHWPGSARIYGENIALVSMMILALLLPIRSFFRRVSG